MLRIAATLVAIAAGVIGFGLLAYVLLSKHFDPRSDRGRAVRAAAVTALVIMVVGVGISTFAN